MTLRRLDFPVLARGMDREAPRGTLNPQAAEGPLWRELQNLVPHDGVLRRREALTEFAGSAPTFLDDEDQVPLGLFEMGSTDSGTRLLLVTTREMFSTDDFVSWVNLTPRYETGTVTIATGTNVIVGTSTEFELRLIVDGQPIELPRGSGDWYVIDEVVSDTALTLTTNYTGVNLSGDNYSIRRTFGQSSSDDHVFAVSLNGDVYVAGMLAHRELSAGGHLADGAVLKITGGANLLATLTAAGSVSFLTAGLAEVTSGLDILGDWILRIYGLTVLADGRLVFAAQWANSALSEAANNRIYYSSHLNLAVWTTSPGGFIDVVGHNGRGSALTGGSRGVFFHFTDGIEIGDLTGAQDPPLRLRPSEATIGAVGPKMVAAIPGGRAIPPGDLFVGADRTIYLFNGGDATPIRWASTTGDLDDFTPSTLFGQGFSRVDSFRKYVSFFVPASGVSGTKELRVYYDDEVYLICRYPHTTVTAAASMPNGNFLCVPRLDDAGEESGVIYSLSESATADETPLFSGGLTSIICSATSDVISDPVRVWAVSHVEVLLSKITTGTFPLTLRIIRDGVSEDMTVNVGAGVGTTTNQQAIRFFPSADSGRDIQVQLFSGVTADSGQFAFTLSRMVVWLADVGEARAA